MRGARLLFLASWVSLFLLSSVVIALSLSSLGTAYFGDQDQLVAGFGLEQLEGAGGQEAVKAFRGRRATAATWALGWGMLYGCMALIPYRRKERWAWWAMVTSNRCFRNTREVWGALETIDSQHRQAR